MKVLLLAAGIGSRLGNLTADKHKSLLAINGEQSSTGEMDVGIIAVVITTVVLLILLLGISYCKMSRRRRSLTGGTPVDDARTTFPVASGGLSGPSPHMWPASPDPTRGLRPGSPNRQILELRGRASPARLGTPVNIAESST